MATNRIPRERRTLVPAAHVAAEREARCTTATPHASGARALPHFGSLVALVVLGTLSSACAPGPPASGGTRFSLQQKGHFQALYDANGQMLRLLQDNDGDGRAEIVVVFGPKGKPERGEMDTDGDGVVDRREHFAPDGTLTRVEALNATSVAPSPSPSPSPEQTPSNDRKPTGNP